MFNFNIDKSFENVMNQYDFIKTLPLNFYLIRFFKNIKVGNLNHQLDWLNQDIPNHVDNVIQEDLKMIAHYFDDDEISLDSWFQDEDDLEFIPLEILNEFNDDF